MGGGEDRWSSHTIYCEFQNELNFDMDMSNGREVLTVRSDDLTRQIVRSYASALS
jgi:hypothetical protein